MFSALWFPLQVSLLSSEHWRGLVENTQLLSHSCAGSTQLLHYKKQSRQFLRTSLTPRGIPMTFLSFSFFFFFHCCFPFHLVTLKLHLTLFSFGYFETASHSWSLSDHAVWLRMAQARLRLAAAFLPHSLEPTYSVKIKVGIWLWLFPVLEKQPLTFHTLGTTHPASDPHAEPCCQS